MMQLAPKIVLGAACAAWLVLCPVARSEAGDDFRTWKDATGKFSIKAKLIGAEGDKVKLEREDGSRVEIELKKLSEVDQAFVAGATSNPFQPSDSPFKPAMPTPGAAAGGVPRTVKVNWSLAQSIPLIAPSDAWEVTLPAADTAGDFQPRTVSLPPKSDFFEGMKGMAVNTVAQKAVVGYVLGKPRSTGTTRIVLCDLKTGRTVATATAPGQMTPIALHDDGQQILMRRDEFGFGKLDRLEVWALRGSQVVKSLIWTPYENEQGGKRDVMWAEFLDNGLLATSSRGGKVALWNFATAEPICWFQLSDGSVPALSADRKWIAFCSSKNFGLFDVQQRQVIAMSSTPDPLQWPYVAFSPSGRLIGCIAFNRMLVWDVATGELQREVPCTGINVHGAIAYPDDSFILGANKFLVDVDNQLKFWQYDGAEQVRSVKGWTFMGVTNGDRPGALLAVKIPHKESIDLLKKALDEPNLFVFRKGTRVRLDVRGIEAAQQARVTASLTKKLVELGCPVDNRRGTIDLVASVDPPKTREVSYMHAGDYRVKEYICRLRFVYQGQPAWESHSSNVPGFLMLKRGENVESVLRKSEKPGYVFYDRVELPKFLQKPQPGKGPNSRQTLGQSRVTPSGIQ